MDIKELRKKYPKIKIPSTVKGGDREFLKRLSQWEEASKKHSKALGGPHGFGIKSGEDGDGVG